MSQSLFKKLDSWIPSHISNKTILNVMHLLSLGSGLSKEMIAKHLSRNKAPYEDYKNAHMLNKTNFIEQQNHLQQLCYGKDTQKYNQWFGIQKLNASFNCCEVIALYNALTALDHTTTSFPQLLAHFEKKGIILKGYLGTSIYAIYKYLKRTGYEAKLICHNKKIDVFLKIKQPRCMCIATLYNDQAHLSEEIHTVAITHQNGLYTMHNVGAKPIAGTTIHSLLQQYHKGTAKVISIIAIYS